MALLAGKLQNIDSNAGLPSIEELKRELFVPEAGFIAAPPVPQAEVLVPDSHLPALSQQPIEQFVELQVTP